MQLTIAAILVLHSTTTFAEQKNCLQRNYGENKIVCVCNKEHCDTIPKSEKPAKDEFVTYTSSREGLRFKKETGIIEKNSEESNKQILVSHEQKYQEIIGWGGAFTDSTGINIRSLSEETQEHLLRSYFSEDGLEYSVCRIPIGGTDFSTHGYSYHDSLEDKELSDFKLADEDYKFKIPYIQQSLNLTNNNILFLASAWTAPKWMKTNGDYHGMGSLKEEMYQAWANYHVKFMEEYKKNGIPIWGITTGNEPSLSILPISKINSIAWSHQQMSKYVSENLGPTVRNSNYSTTKIIALDDQIFFLPWYIDKLFSNEKTKSYIDGIALHWYYNKIFGYNALNTLHESYSDKFIISTEACQGSGIFESAVDIGSWERGEDYAYDIIQVTKNFAAGWLDWNMALDLTGGPTYIDNNVDSPILVNASADEFYKQPMYYAIGHFAKFVPRGSVRIGTTENDSGIFSVAFVTPEENTVLVTLNRHYSESAVAVKDDMKGTISLKLPARSITTTIY